MRAGIEFHHVSKRYRIGSKRSSLRELFSWSPQRVLGWGERPVADDDQHIWALNDVSFEAGQGRVLGIIGHNGAGKTTALKLLSGVTSPTAGRIEVAGRVAALIELGAGFHPDLTGRENIYLNGSILGLSHKEIDRKFQSIVDFAELEKFIDTPVKRYSSGMYARLGFAVAAHTDPDVLVVDEVLGVGDANFQRKCHDFIHSHVTGQKIAIFVSHNLYVIEQLCNQLIWMHHGQIMMVGTPGQVLPAYFDHMDQEALDSGQFAAAGDGHLRMTAVEFGDGSGVARDTFTTGEDLVVSIHYKATARIAQPHFCLAVVSAGGGQPLFGASMLIDGAAPSSIAGDGVLRCTFRSVPLMPRTYDVWGEVWSEDRARALINWQKLGTFRVSASSQLTHQGLGTGGVRHLRADAPIRVAYGWDY
jgi:ABC-type polysaccharide/polyol phosphate transport system ATPase subunit